MISAFAYLVTPWGRVSRRTYWIYGLISPIVVAVALFQIYQASPDYEPVQWLVLGLWLLAAYVGWVFAIRRLHDRGRTGWWLLVYLVLLTIVDVAEDVGPPYREVAWMVGFVIALAFFYELSLRRGVAGPNRFGPDPLSRNEANAPTESLPA